MTTFPRRLLCVALVVGVVCGVACRNRTSSGNDAGGQRTTLRVSMIPTTDPGKVLRESQPLVAYLERATGAKVELTVPTNYAAVVEAVANDQVDIAYLGGFTYVQASGRAGVQPLVQRDRDQNFHTLFITRPDSGINKLEDLPAHTFAFGDVNSTSGHLMPRYFMREAGVSIENFKTPPIYSGGHDATALAVANKKVDAGALDEAVYERMVKEGKLDATQVKVFYKTPAFFDYIWVARKGLDPKYSAAFTDSFLKLNAGDAEQKSILDALSAARYVRANDADYAKLRQAAKDAGLLK
jgi:phosphonate transport system substrate-binding protein